MSRTPRRHLAAVLGALLPLLVLAALLPRPAGAAWFGAQVIDGPGADVVSLGGVAVAREGAGALVYIRRDGGVPHVFLSRLLGGNWAAPQRVDAGVAAAATDAKVGVADGGQIVIGWLAGGVAYGAAVTDGATVGPATALSGAGATAVATAMAINGAGYVVWSVAGDLGAARVKGGVWAPVPGPLDVDPAAVADQPAVAVSADGNAIATWREAAADGRTHVYARRITGTRPSAAPQDLTLAGGNASQPSLDVEDDSSFAWVAFRQDDAAGTPHTVARRLVGSLFDPPVAVDGGLAAVTPQVDMTGRGGGQAVSATTSGAVLWSPLARNTFAPAIRIDTTGSTVSPDPVGANSERDDLAVAWRAAGADGNAQVRARYKVRDKAFDGEVGLSRPELGSVPAGGVATSGDRIGNVAVAWVQGPDGSRALSAAVYDRPPGAPFASRTSDFQRRTKPRLTWRAGLDLWGAQQFKVFVDKTLVGTTSQSPFVSPVAVTPGKHTWRVVAVDVRGQESASSTRPLRLDALAPRVSVKVSGRRSAGQTLKVELRGTDRGGAGIAKMTVDWGDRTRIETTKGSRKTFSHRYSKSGSRTLSLKATDKAGNVGRRSVKLRIG